MFISDMCAPMPTATWVTIAKCGISVGIVSNWKNIQKMQTHTYTHKHTLSQNVEWYYAICCKKNVTRNYHVK